ncbi:MAG: AraC family transcriptional regulator [Bacteroidaceae bacterium]|nr:AraC family transcriptional regulator [Bacteroidaceae bacterium]
MFSFMLSIPSYCDEGDDFWNVQPEPLRQRYQLALKSADNVWVLSFADSLDNLAIEDNADKFKYFASSIRGLHFFYKNDSLHFFSTNKKSQKLAKQLGYNSRYYMLMLNEVYFYTNTSYMRQAQEAASKLLDDAKKTGDLNGLRSGYYATAIIFWKKHNYKRAVEYYKKALEYAEKTPETSAKSKAHLYAYIAECYYEQKDYENAIKYSEKGLRVHSKTPLLLVTQARTYYRINDKDKFTEAYNRFKDTRTTNMSIYNLHAPYIDALYFTMNGRFIEALKRCEDISTEKTKYTYLIEVYSKMNDWKMAFSYKDKLERLEDSISNVSFNVELAEMTKEIDSLNQLKKKDEILIRQRSYLILSAVIIVAILICCILGLSRYNAVKKKNKALALCIDKYITSKKMVLKLEGEKYAKQDADEQSRAQQIGKSEIESETKDEEDEVNSSETSKEVESKDDAQIARFIYELSSRELFTDPNFNRDTLLDELHIQKRTFSKKFENYTGSSFKEYITSLRLDYAAKLIKEHPEYTIEAIAMECGINSYVTFHRNFTRHFGIAPSSFRGQ